MSVASSGACSCSASSAGDSSEVSASACAAAAASSASTASTISIASASAVAAASAAASASAAAAASSASRYGLELLHLGDVAALGNHLQAEIRGDVREDLDRNLVPADPLHGVAELDPPSVYADLVVAPEPVGNIGRRDRAEERAGRAGLHVEADHRLLEPLCDLAGLVVRSGLLPGAHLVVASKFLEPPG